MTIIAKGREMLQRILDNEPPIPRPVIVVDSLSNETRSKIKRAFSAVKCKAMVLDHWHFGKIIAVRPDDVDKFYGKLKEAKLETDAFCQGMIAALKESKDYYVRFG